MAGLATAGRTTVKPGADAERERRSQERQKIGAGEIKPKAAPPESLGAPTQTKQGNLAALVTKPKGPETMPLFPGLSGAPAGGVATGKPIDKSEPRPYADFPSGGRPDPFNPKHQERAAATAANRAAADAATAIPVGGAPAPAPEAPATGGAAPPPSMASALADRKAKGWSQKQALGLDAPPTTEAPATGGSSSGGGGGGGGGVSQVTRSGSTASENKIADSPNDPKVAVARAEGKKVSTTQSGAYLAGEGGKTKGPPPKAKTDEHPDLEGVDLRRFKTNRFKLLA